MGDKTGIQWTEATWNPIVGCSMVSPGCTNCYAMAMAGRIARMNHRSHYTGTTMMVKRKHVWTGRLFRAPNEIFYVPLAWSRARMIFANSMSDLFHESIPIEWIDEAFAVMWLAPHHLFQVLTKRSGRMREYFSDPQVFERIAEASRKILREVKLNRLVRQMNELRKDKLDGPLANVWLGVSAEDQTRANERVPDLLKTPATIRFVSAEPLLGPIDFEEVGDINALTGFDFDQETTCENLDWIIVGGESGLDARMMDIAWAGQIVQQCRDRDVKVFVKQLGDQPAVQLDDKNYRMLRFNASKAGDPREWPADLRIREMPSHGNVDAITA